MYFSDNINREISPPDATFTSSPGSWFLFAENRKLTSSFPVAVKWSNGVIITLNTACLIPMLTSNPRISSLNFSSDATRALCSLPANESISVSTDLICFSNISICSAKDCIPFNFFPNSSFKAISSSTFSKRCLCSKSYITFNRSLITSTLAGLYSTRSAIRSDSSAISSSSRITELKRCS